MTGIIDLERDGATVRVAPELGARITRCNLLDPQGRSVDLFHPYPEHHTDLLHWAKGGMYPLLPYWGRIAQAQLTHEGERIALCPHPDALPHTLHGTAHQAVWRVAHREEAALTLRLEKEADAHWPWRYDAELLIVLSRTSLRIDISVRNADERSMPAGLGLHPYLCCLPSARLQFEARKNWVMTADFLGLRAEPVAAEDDLHTARSPGHDALTRCYGDWNGQLGLIDGAEESPVLKISASPTLDHLVLHRPADAPYLCVEPVSHTADAFNRAADGVPHTGTRVLAPGHRLQGCVEFVLECP